MSKISFCRTVRFTASHYYAIVGHAAAENEARFGSSAQPHFHDWALTVWLEGPLDEKTGMMIDLGLVDRILEEEVVMRFHQKNINQADSFFEQRQPTNEVLAQYFATRLSPRFEPVRLVRLRIAEDPDLFAEWRQ